MVRSDIQRWPTAVPMMAPARAPAENRQRARRKRLPGENDARQTDRRWKRMKSASSSRRGPRRTRRAERNDKRREEHTAAHPRSSRETNPGARTPDSSGEKPNRQRLGGVGRALKDHQDRGGDEQQACQQKIDLRIEQSRPPAKAVTNEGIVTFSSIL